MKNKGAARAQPFFMDAQRCGYVLKLYEVYCFAILLVHEVCVECKFIRKVNFGFIERFAII